MVFNSPIVRITLIGDHSERMSLLRALLDHLDSPDEEAGLGSPTQEKAKPFRRLPFTGTIEEAGGAHVLTVRFSEHNILEQDQTFPQTGACKSIVFYLPASWQRFEEDLEQMKECSSHLTDPKAQFFVIMINQNTQSKQKAMQLSKKIFQSIFEDEQCEIYNVSCLRVDQESGHKNGKGIKNIRESGVQNLEVQLLNVFSSLIRLNLKQLSTLTLRTATSLCLFLERLCSTAIASDFVDDVEVRLSAGKVTLPKTHNLHSEEPHYVILQPENSISLHHDISTAIQLRNKAQKLVWQLLFKPVQQKHQTLTDEIVSKWIGNLGKHNPLDLLKQYCEEVPFKAFKPLVARLQPSMKAGVIFSLLVELNDLLE